MKAFVVVLSDPVAGGEEALGRLFNALAVIHDVRARGGEARLVFQGAGTRWAPRIVDPGHPANGLYAQVQDDVVGVSRGCATVFGALEDAERAGFATLSDNAVPGTEGLPSLAAAIQAGFTVMTF